MGVMIKICVIYNN